MIPFSLLLPLTILAIKFLHLDDELGLGGDVHGGRHQTEDGGGNETKAVKLLLVLLNLHEGGHHVKQVEHADGHGGDVHGGGHHTDSVVVLHGHSDVLECG